MIALVTLVVLAWAAREVWLSRQASRTDWLHGLNQRVSRGRIRCDPQYVRTEFAAIAAGMPELQRVDRRLLDLYLVPDNGGSVS